MRAKAAPNLSQLVEDAAKFGLGYYPAKARAELRALLAVVRAARMVNAVDEEEWSNVSHNARALDANDRALARLDRLNRSNP